jgi:hypothetical protein
METYSVGSRRVQRLRIALSKGPDRVGVSLPSPEEGKRSSFRNTMFSSYLALKKDDGQSPQTQSFWRNRICCKSTWLSTFKQNWIVLVISWNILYRMFQSELNNFESLYKFIQTTYTVFWTVIMYRMILGF